ncbi:MAG: hypothetical protein KJ007_07155 [Burkholderiales bacterium]|nr:hypothetical protein [Burkholderiales bacterium]
MIALGSSPLAAAPIASGAAITVPLASDGRYIAEAAARAFAAEATGRAFTAAAIGRRFTGESS